VPHQWLGVSFQAKFDIYGTSSTCWPVAYVGIGYYDAVGNQLGETRIYHHNSYCTWVPTGTLSLIEVTNPDWTQYDIDIAQEIAQHLPGVNPADVRQVRVALADTTAGG
jgi:ABC-type amino acid transport substrate-binding protein